MNKTLPTLVLLLAVFLVSVVPAPETPKTIHWLIAHDRDDSFFHDFMKGFAERLEKSSGGSLKIEFVPITAPDSKWGEIGRESVIKGEAEMSQLASGSLNTDQH